MTTFQFTSNQTGINFYKENVTLLIHIQFTWKKSSHLGKPSVSITQHLQSLGCYPVTPLATVLNSWDPGSPSCWKAFQADCQEAVKNELAENQPDIETCLVPIRISLSLPHSHGTYWVQWISIFHWKKTFLWGNFWPGSSHWQPKPAAWTSTKEAALPTT